MRHLFSIPLGQEIAPKAIPKNYWQAIAAGVSALGSLAGGLINNNANSNLNATNRRFQMGENWKNRDFTERMWNQQNEYNTPANQRARLQEAGYNPWMSGSGSPQSVAGAAGTPASQGAPSAVPMKDVISPAMQTGINTYMQGKALDAQIANQSANTLKQALDVYKEARMNGMSKDDAMKTIEPFLKASQGMNDSNRYLDMVDKQIVAQDWQNKEYQLSYEINSKLSQKERQTALMVQEKMFDKMSGELGLMSSEADVNYANEAFIRGKAKNLVSEYIRNMADAYKLRKEGDKYVADAATINAMRDSLVEGLRYQNMILSNPANDAAALNDAKSGYRNWLVSDEGRKEVTHKYRLTQQGSVDALKIVSGVWNDVMPSLFTGAGVSGNGRKSEYGSSSSDSVIMW